MYQGQFHRLSRRGEMGGSAADRDGMCLGPLRPREAHRRRAHRLTSALLDLRSRTGVSCFSAQVRCVEFKKGIGSQVEVISSEEGRAAHRDCATEIWVYATVMHWHV